jgi:AcrR family transcriptional regulator
MTSLRHNQGLDRLDDREHAYLDAARACILDVGWRRTTLTEVARRAGVSRMTIYRTWSDMPQLLSDLMTREWSGVVADALADEDPDTPTVERLVGDIVGTVQRLRENELFIRIVDLDPELILPYLFSRRGRSQDAIMELTVAALREAQAAGEVRTGSPVLMARSMLLAAHGFVLSAHTMVDDDVSLDELDGELRLALTRGLQP